ncbi:MAG: pilus assembly protein [Chloroflexota bacterium]|nr:pilus assembly protein [Chloroflexota bacterium]
MFSRRRSKTPLSRGQAMVEFALILPILALLLVLALDAGRVFFGWVGLHNATRIAANEAGLAPDAWSGAGIASKQGDYRQMVANDLNAMNCLPPDMQPWKPSDVPDPSFENKQGTADPYEIGDHAVVNLDCDFDLIFPLAENLLGDTLNISAFSQFAVRGGLIAGVPVGPAPPPGSTPTCATGAVVPLLRGMTVLEARVAWSAATFTGTLNPVTGPDDSNIVDGQNTSPPTAPGDCADKTTSVTVTHSVAPTCAAGEFVVPSLITLTVEDARDKWDDAGFTGSFTPVVGNDDQIVKSQSTSTGRAAGQCSTETTLVVVGYGPPTPSTCTAPDMTGLTKSAASSAYSGAPASFTGTFKSTGPGSGTVVSQSLVGGQPYPCTSGVTVTLKN